MLDNHYRYTQLHCFSNNKSNILFLISNCLHVIFLNFIFELHYYIIILILVNYLRYNAGNFLSII